jgi:hypothetical protein
MVIDLRLSNVMFEIDYVNVVNCCKGTKHITSIDPFIVDYIELLSKLVNCFIKFVSPTCNSAAHELAQAPKIGFSYLVGKYPILSGLVYFFC